MKYMIMLYGSQQFYDMMAGKPTDGPVMTAEELEAMHTYMGEFHQKLVESGELVDARGLAWCAGTGTSTPPTTPSRRLCWPPRRSGPSKGSPTTRGRG